MIAKIIKQTHITMQRGVTEMSKNNAVVPQAREALDKFKMEAAREVGVQIPLEKRQNNILYCQINNITYKRRCRKSVKRRATFSRR